MNAEELCGKGGDRGGESGASGDLPISGDHGDVFVEGSRRYSASFRVKSG